MRQKEVWNNKKSTHVREKLWERDYLAMLTGLAVDMRVVGISSRARLQRTLMSVMS